MASAHVTPVDGTNGGKVVSTFVGIDLEYCNVADVSAQLNMTESELKELLGPNKTWPHPAALDGWKLSHDAIRWDMDNMVDAIAKSRSQVDGGNKLSDWQVTHYKALMKSFYHQVHDHHDHEELIFFPWMSTRVNLPPKMSSDHKTLMAQLDRCNAIITGLASSQELAAQQAAFKELVSTFSAMRACMRQHLEEEEIVGLPMLRKHFTAPEMMATEKKIIATLKPADMAWFLRPMAWDVKVETMTRFRIPGLAQKLVLLPACRKDERTLVRMYRELQAGSLQQPTKKAGFLCFSG